MTPIDDPFDTSAAPQQSPPYSGYPSGPTAPKSDLLDAGDLDEMRTALREGKTVGVGSDGRVYVAREASGPPMTDASETFIETKLAQLQVLLEHGYGFTVRSDGSINGNSADGGSKFIAAPDRTLSDFERELVEKSIVAGDDVMVYPDGTLHLIERPGLPPRSTAEADYLLGHFRQHVTNGLLDRTQSEGKLYRVTADGVIGSSPVSKAPVIEFPDAPPVDVTVEAPSTPADQRAENLRRQREDAVRVGDERDDAAREAYGARQQASAADQQVKREQRAAEEANARATAADAQAARLERSGKTAEAAEAREQALLERNRAEIAATRAARAQEEGAELRAAAARLDARVKELDAELQAIEARSVADERAVDAAESAVAPATTAQADGADDVTGAQTVAALAAIAPTPSVEDGQGATAFDTPPEPGALDLGEPVTEVAATPDAAPEPEPVAQTDPEPPALDDAGQDSEEPAAFTDDALA